MRTVSVIGFNGALASAVTGIIDLFRLAGVTWARIHGDEPQPWFRTRLLTHDGEPCKCINGLTLVSDGAWNEPDRDDSDLIIIPTIGAPIEKVLADNSLLIEWLGNFRTQETPNVHVASNCTGAFFLAEAGLLDGREATTHWGFSNQFRERYPRVQLHPEKLVTVDGPVACAGGGMAWWDLGVYLVERFAGPQVARELAKAFVIDAGRSSQAPYSALQAKRYHSDAIILALQDWLDDHFREALSLPALAGRAGLSERSLLRRFRQATGDTPNTYVQLLRVERARRQLESSGQSIDAITRDVGYEDISSFSRLFRKHTGLSPGAYRARFGR
ncbi:AraC family transcriptional regulator [Marinobacter santoriniensis NKSG1]|uniref:AraC family transcriptional regulator n=1 Tax=Marinobacter santoriniensis NKSG1 TaxID=1288826 RepID=M7D5W6_9GAMM|nr:helix-turn-helix domain-containing protein [Marinobacter santoriniensis]EMP56123.1 AraC family transcriptional regulator [Marinobacter santoriniensis NKSG1]